MAGILTRLSKYATILPGMNLLAQTESWWREMMTRNAQKPSAPGALAGPAVLKRGTIAIRGTVQIFPLRERPAGCLVVAGFALASASTDWPRRNRASVDIIKSVTTYRRAGFGR
jgi:hypothetical protein